MLYAKAAQRYKKNVNINTAILIRFDKSVHF